MASKSFCRGGPGPEYTLPPGNASKAGDVIYAAADGKCEWGSAAGGTISKRENVKGLSHPSNAEIAASSFTIYEVASTFSATETMITVFVERTASTPPTGTTAILVPLTHKIKGPTDVAQAGKYLCSIASAAETANDYKIIQSGTAGQLFLDLNSTLGAPADVGTNAIGATYISG
jgi:hypothetical protein